jgi:hypothetical protein
MLAIDAFHGHLSDRIRNRLRNKNTALVIICSGKIKRALASITVEWISTALKEVPVSIIPKTF